MRAREFIKENASPAGTVTIYVDMDGVIVDLYNHIGKMLGVHYSTVSGDQWEDFYQNVDAYKLFKTAPMFKNAFTLLELVKKHSGKHGILSTPLMYNTDECIRAKKDWLNSHAPEWAGNPIFTNTKEKYAISNGIPNILIDDSASVIRKWEAAGGIAIKYKADEDSLQVVVNGLRNADQIISKLQQSKNSKESNSDSDVEETIEDTPEPKLGDIIREVLPLIKHELKISKLPTIRLVTQINAGNQPTFGLYQHETDTLEVVKKNRHPVDILRTLAHELVHYKQDIQNRLRPHSGDTGSNIEDQANAMAGVIMRHINKKYPNFLKLDNVES
jgi:uncharacterized protein YbaR (Trm112 family)